MQPEEQSGPPQAPLRRHSTGGVRVVQTRPMPMTRRSVDNAFTAIPGHRDRTLEGANSAAFPSASLHASALRQHDRARQPGTAIRDSGHATDFSPSMPPLELRPVDQRENPRAERVPQPARRPRHGPPRASGAARHRRRGLAGRVRRVIAFFGYGTDDRYRKELVSLTWTLSFGLAQFVVTVAVLAYSGSHRSPTQPTLSEWRACDKPLGVWGCIWIVKTVFDCCMTYWSWTRNWKVRQSEQNQREGDIEQDLPGLNRGLPAREQIDPTTFEPLNDRRRRGQATAPFSKLFSRLSLLLSLIIITWFLVSNIFVFTSVNTCRLAAPHLWWLVFGQLCLQYLVIIEVFAIALLVFIIGPLIYLLWNIILICLGRHPMQNPHYINPEIGKLPKSLVDQIPLVLYIPSPPDGEKQGAGDGASPSDAADAVANPEPVYTPGSGAEHTYPPKPPAPKRRFTFLSRKSSKSPAGLDEAPSRDEKSGASAEASVWEDCWEHGAFPFVRLDENRAACAICLLDFEAPQRRVARAVIRSWAQKNSSNADREADATGEKDPEAPEGAESADASSSSDRRRRSDVQEVPVAEDGSSSSESGSHALRLRDAGEGPQPLRLLECGHVFHKTCIDPWLIDVSGRCPTCQRPVIRTPQKQERDRNRP